MIKPSECPVTCSNLLAELIPRYLDNVRITIFTPVPSLSVGIIRHEKPSILPMIEYAHYGADPQYTVMPT